MGTGDILVFVLAYAHNFCTYISFALRRRAPLCKKPYKTVICGVVTVIRLSKTDISEIFLVSRKKVLDKWYVDGYINTPYGRKIKVEERKALNYLLQSTTSDRVLAKAVKIDKFLAEHGCNSYISHIVHDEIVIDYDDADRKHIPQIKEIFEDGYLCNLTAGKDYYNLKELSV